MTRGNAERKVSGRWKAVAGERGECPTHLDHEVLRRAGERDEVVEALLDSNLQRGVQLERNRLAEEVAATPWRRPGSIIRVGDDALPSPRGAFLIRPRQAVAGLPLRSIARLSFGHDSLRFPDAFDNSLYDLFGAHGRPPS